MKLRDGSDIVRSDGWVNCDHANLYTVWRHGAQVVETGPRCTIPAHFVQSWRGRISMEMIHKPLCKHHGMEAIKRSRKPRERTDA